MNRTSQTANAEAVADRAGRSADQALKQRAARQQRRRHRQQQEQQADGGADEGVAALPPVAFGLDRPRGFCRRTREGGVGHPQNPSGVASAVGERRRAFGDEGGHPLGLVVGGEAEWNSLRS